MRAAEKISIMFVVFDVEYDEDEDVINYIFDVM